MNGVMFELYASFKEVRGYAVSAASLVIALILFYIDPDDTISVKWLFVGGTIAGIGVMVLVDFSIRAYRGATAKLPAVRAAKASPALYRDAIALLLLEKSPLFGHESLVSVYLKDEDFEILIGIGFVLTIQKGGLIQVLVTANFDPKSNNIWKEVIDNNVTTLKKLIIKPSIPRQANSFGA